MIMDREIREMHILSWNLAEEYAKRFHLPDKAAVETEWQFRERVARSLDEMEERLVAHEVLYNRHMSGDPFAQGKLSDGYGDEFITRIALQTELAFQHTKQQQQHQQRWQKLLSMFRLWQKSKVEE